MVFVGRLPVKNLSTCWYRSLGTLLLSSLQLAEANYETSEFIRLFFICNRLGTQWLKILIFLDRALFTFSHFLSVDVIRYRKRLIFQVYLLFFVASPRYFHPLLSVMIDRACHVLLRYEVYLFGFYARRCWSFGVARRRLLVLGPTVLLLDVGWQWFMF